jgi:hypothetical protein
MLSCQFSVADQATERRQHGPDRLHARCLLGRIQGDDCDFGRAVQAEGQAYGADAAVDVELHLIEAVETFGVLFAHGRQDERTQERKPDLTSVGVTGEHQVDEMAARVGDDLVGEVGFVRHEKDGAVGFGGEGEVEVGMAGARVVEAAEPETTTVAFDGEVLVHQYGSAICNEGMDDGWAVKGDVVVAEDGITERSGESGEYLGAAVEGMLAGDEGEGAMSYEVAGEEDEIGGQGVDLMDDAFEEEGLGVLVEVDVAELDDAVAAEGRGQIGDGNGAVNYVDFVTCDLAGVESQTSGGGAGGYEEVSPGKTWRLRGGNTGHKS